LKTTPVQVCSSGKNSFVWIYWSGNGQIWWV
jgi:hypothetical protein